MLFFGLFCVLLISAIRDVKERKIPNLITLPSAIIAILCHIFSDGWQGLIFSFQGIAVGFFLFIMLYAIGVMGAGDVKLMSVVGAVFGPKNTLTVLLFIMVMSGVLALFLMWHRGVIKKSLSRLWMIIFLFATQQNSSFFKEANSELAEEGMPLAVAIAAGVFLYVIYIWITTGMFPLLSPG